MRDLDSSKSFLAYDLTVSILLPSFMVATVVMASHLVESLACVLEPIFKSS
jgi:hypothetical protein